MNDMQTQLDYADSIAEWFLEMGEAHNLRADFTNGLKSTYIAAAILSRQNRILASPRLESNLRHVAGCFADDNRDRKGQPHKSGGKETCLHVLSEALPAGGLTAMAIRWMRNDRSRRIHSVALLSRRLPIPTALLTAVRDSGGNVYTANPDDSFLHQGAWLRKLANDWATYVILHVDVSDVICGVAFGKKGGPPVLLVNHTAHSFWTGASIADLVVNCRGSALEGFWTGTYRGTPKYATVPIPLLEPEATAAEIPLDLELKRQAKKSIGIPPDSFVILTVGSAFKYIPANSLDFVEVVEGILRLLPKAFLLAVGFNADSRWSNASLRVESRIKALGTMSQSQLAKIHEATDIYIEGFPFGTTTSLLEAGLKGIPVVLAPAQCPPPYGSDGVALDDTLERPRTLEEYKDRIIRLSSNSDERTLLGEKIRASVTKHHTGPGWRQYLEEAIRALPQEHEIYPSLEPVRTPDAIHEYWSAFLMKWTSSYKETLEQAMIRSLSIGLRPRLTNGVLRACREHRTVRAHRSIPLPLLVFFCSFLLPSFPITWGRNCFRILSYVFRGSLPSRMRISMIRWMGGTDRPKGPYEEYSRMRDGRE